MAKIDQGVFVFNEWFESARGLSGLEFKKLFLAMYDYQVNGKKPPSFTPKGETIAKIVFPCLEKRVNGAIYARMGALEQNSQLTDEGTKKPAEEPAGVKSFTHATKEEKRKENNKIIYYRTRVGAGSWDWRTREEIEAEREKDKKWQEFFDVAAKRALGEK